MKHSRTGRAPGFSKVRSIPSIMHQPATNSTKHSITSVGIHLLVYIVSIICYNPMCMVEFACIAQALSNSHGLSLETILIFVTLTSAVKEDSYLISCSSRGT
ncbi:hypothetical protein BDR06DRAFT_330357 [Suillus hirtellus]|nr:hypothetical protein BDR06DRAFT_330357 [Suillus hirtellus]